MAREKQSVKAVITVTVRKQAPVLNIKNHPLKNTFYQPSPYIHHTSPRPDMLKI